jgi:hypothetical protein
MAEFQPWGYQGREIYPCVIVPARYGWEGGLWTAFACRFDEIPDEAFGGDFESHGWWKEDAPDLPVAVGDSPSEAYENLKAKFAHLRDAAV